MSRQEIYLLPRPVKSAASFSVNWVYPSTYEVAMAGLGYQLIWWLLEQDPEVAVHRVFTDYQESGWQTSELFGVTLAWELDYIHVLELLGKRGAPLLSTERTLDDPLVFGGGPVLAANPEPFAGFFDVVLMGDAEILIPRFLEAWKTIRQLKTRRDQLIALAEVDGLYVPSLYEYTHAEPCGPLQAVTPTAATVPRVVRREAYQPPADYIAHSVVLAPESSWGDMFLAEIVRSCPQECRFCLASYLTRPFRAANIDTLLERIDMALKHTKKIGLLGPSVTEHPQFSELAARLMQRTDAQISVASIRIDTIEKEILEMLVKLGQKSVTIALESGSERLRSIMKKNLTEEQIHRAMDLIAGSGLKGVKLYGIVGLPGETKHDLDETIRLLTQLKKKHKQLRITFGISTFVPKAQTPFQWSGRDLQAGKNVEYLRKNLAKTGIDVRPESHNWSDIQAVLSRGDRRLTPLLQNVAKGAGNLGAWKKAFKENVDTVPSIDFYAFRDIPYDEVLPWRHLVDDVKAGMLYKHSNAAKELAITITG